MQLVVSSSKNKCMNRRLVAKVQFVAKSEKGLVRNLNEDRFIAAENLLAVADGMGGHLAGEVAAQIAIDTLKGTVIVDPVLDCLRNVFQAANRTIFERGKNNKEQEGMGTTLTAVYLQDLKAYLAHVGDSRAYLICGDSIRQLTEDHSYVNQLVALGTLSKEEAKKHPQRNILLRVLGIDEEIEVDVNEISLNLGDRILLASDGLFTDVSQEKIAEILTKGLSIENTATELIDAALAAGGKDNVTVVIGEV